MGRGGSSGEALVRRQYLGYFVRSLSSAALVLTSLWGAGASNASADFAGMQRLASDVGGITLLAQRPGDPNHLVVGVKEGLLLLMDIETGAFEPTPFLNLTSELDYQYEGGLMGLAFDPNYQENGKFYVTVTIDNGGVQIDPVNNPDAVSPYSAHVRQYGMSDDPNVASDEFVTLLQWVKPQIEHTGGWLGFGPHNDYLHILTGDGGGANDASVGHTPGSGNAQDLTDNFMGKLLRIDPHGDDFPDDLDRNYAIPSDNPFAGVEGDDEIFAYGMRSPWKASFDRATGDLWIGDVGQDSREEIDVILADSTGGENFGWNKREGFVATPEVGGPPPPGNVLPAFDYVHIDLPGDPSLEGNSVTGGYIYRGPDPSLQGKYIFADFISAQIWMFDPASPYGTVTNITSLLEPDVGNANLFTTFGEDSAGNLYVATITGNVFRLLTDAVVPGDFQEDGNVDINDLAIWHDQFGLVGEPGKYEADANNSGRVNGRDFLIWQRNAGYSAVDPPHPDPVGDPAGQFVPEPQGSLLILIALARYGIPRLRRAAPSLAV